MSDKDNALKDGSSPAETVTPAEKPVVETLGEALEAEPKKDDDRVPLNKYMEEKRARRDAEAQAETLQAEISKLKVAGMSGNMPITEVNEQLRKLAEEHNVDETFLTKLVSTVRTATKSEIKEELEKDYNPKLAKLEQERKLEQAEKKFDAIFSKSLKDMPEYDGVVNKEVIKALAFNPANGKKTLPQIIEEAYGSAIQGRKSIESSHPSREAETPNIVNPTKEDWEKIEADPKAKEDWSKSTEQTLRQFM